MERITDVYAAIKNLFQILCNTSCSKRIFLKVFMGFHISTGLYNINCLFGKIILPVIEINV